MSKIPSTRTHGAGGERGFTLLEVLVAFTIVALVIGGAYAAIASGSRATARADVAVQALTRAESALARVGTEWPLAEGRQSDQSAGWVTVVTIAPDSGDRLVWTRLGLMPYRVTVSVTAPGAAPLTLETLRLGPAP